MADQFDCEQCKPFTFDLGKFLRELFCIHHFVFYKNAYIKHTCHKCGMAFTSQD